MKGDMTSAHSLYSQAINKSSQQLQHKKKNHHKNKDRRHLHLCVEVWASLFHVFIYIALPLVGCSEKKKKLRVLRRGNEVLGSCG